MFTLPAKALWSDVGLPDRPSAFDDWAREQGLDPATLLVRPVLKPSSNATTTALVTVDAQVWATTTSPSTWDLQALTLTPEALADLRQVVDDADLVPSGPNDTWTVEPQAWRVLAHLAHWENQKLNASIDDDENLDRTSAYQLARCSNAFERHPLDEATFTRLREHYLTSSHRSGMTMDQYHAWWGRSQTLLNQSGGLSESTHHNLVAHLHGDWAAFSSEEQQTLAHKVFKPHPMHKVLFNQEVERWHLERTLASLPTNVGEPTDEIPMTLPLPPSRSRL